MKALNHTGFSSTIKHEKHAKIKGRKISENEKTWKSVNAAFSKDLRRSDKNRIKSDSFFRGQFERLQEAELNGYTVKPSE